MNTDVLFSGPRLKQAGFLVLTPIEPGPMQQMNPAYRTSKFMLMNLKCYIYMKQ